MKKFTILAILILQFIFAATGYAQSPTITNGLNYLFSVQNPDGSWGNEASGTESLPSTIATIEALKALNQTNTQAYANALVWLQSQGLQTTDYFSERIHALMASGADRDVLLSYLDDLIGAWGGYNDYDVNNLDTALALQALKAVNYSDTNVISTALAYLTSTRNSDGGWGFYKEDDSNVYMTAMVSSTLQQFLQTTSIATAISKATDYILAHQNADGGFGTPASTVFETACSYMALMGTITDNTVLGNAVNYLNDAQLENGSWLQDPYNTALALRALYMSENRPTPPPPPDKGTVTGRVIDASTNQALNGVSVVLQNNTVVNTLTDGTGYFTLSKIAPGSQKMNFSLSGYSTSSVTVNITAGSIVQLGNIPLSSDPTTCIIKGTVKDAANGQPLSDVTITVTGSFTGNTVTSADGTFIFAGIAPGSVTITASKTGYYSVTGTGTVSAGGILFFNPQLSTQPPLATTGNLTGKIFDVATNKPIQGATISLSGGPATTTNALGISLIEGIAPSTYQVTISASEYTSQTYQVMILADVTIDMQTIYLSPATPSTTVTGKVMDVLSGNPIAGADIAVIGTSFSAKTDSTGTYTIAGITQLEFNLRASAVGYDSLMTIISLIKHGSYTIDFPLPPSQGDLKIASFLTDKQHYTAYAPVTIMVDVLNSGAATMSGTVSVSILNAQGEIVDNLQATMTDTEGVVQNRFDFQPAVMTPITIPWETGNHISGTYNIVARVIKGDVGVGGEAVAVAKQRTAFVIDPTQAIAGLTLTPLPRFSNLGAAEQISIQAGIVNRSNVTTELSLAYEWHSPGGPVLHSGSVTISLLPAETSKSVTLETFPYTFAQSGEHSVVVQIISGPTPVSVEGEAISVAPGIRIEPSQNLTPATALPDGDKRMRINIQLRGVEQK